MGYFTNKLFIKKLSLSSNEDGIIIIADEYRSMMCDMSLKKHQVVDAHSVILNFIISRGIDIDQSAFNTIYFNTNKSLKILTTIKDKIENRRLQERFDVNCERFRYYFSGTLTYEFSDSDYDRIQQLIAEIRREIKKSKVITDDHKSRLLRRLEAMQNELHKTISDVDRFWGFIAELTLTAYKFGKNINPIIEKAKELAVIIYVAIKVLNGFSQIPSANSLFGLSKSNSSHSETQEFSPNDPTDDK